MLKIPELPIYNTERYTNFSPISPDDIRPGDIYTNDSLFLYVSHFSFNKTAGYSVWDKEGEYVGTDMFSSDNIYAIVTYLNNNNFRPLDYDLEVIDPFNTDRRLLLTPNGIKKVNNVEEKYIRKKVSKLDEKVVRQILKRIIVENVRNIVEEMDIDPKNKGKFTATQKRTGKSTEELCHSKNPLTRKRANFAKMAKRGWKPLNEAFKSNILRNLHNGTQERYGYSHGSRDFDRKLNSDAEANGIPNNRNGLSTHAYLDKITDDMIDVVGTREELSRKYGYTFGSHRTYYGIGSQEVYDNDNNRRYAMMMRNGTIIVFKNDEKTMSKLKQLSDEAGDIYQQREKNKRNDGARDYQWSTYNREMAYKDWRDTGVGFWDKEGMHPNWRKESWIRNQMDKALGRNQ